LTLPAQLNVVADYQDLCGECPVWDARTEALYWTDCVGRRFYRFEPAARKHEILKQGLEINGYRLNRQQGFVITNNSGIWLWDGAGQLDLIAAEVDGAKCQMNDCISDPAGRLYAGSQYYNPSGKYELGKLMRVDIDGKVTIVDEGFHLSNGLAFSLDHTTLYFTDSVARRIYAYDYDLNTGGLRRRRVLVQVPSNEGLPDGLAVDAAGFLWSAQWYGSCVTRYDPEGRVERRVATPAKQTSSVAFGGKDLTDIFITSAARSEPMPVMPAGYDPSGGFFGGPLYHLNLGIRGRPEFRANISLKR
jgi:sugar lactone lactonase YvrE